MANTWDTPLMVSSRWRTTQSAKVRSSIGDVFWPSLHMPMIMICPMIDEIGANCGLTLSGSLSEASASRSATTWRAW